MRSRPEPAVGGPARAGSAATRERHTIGNRKQAERDPFVAGALRVERVDGVRVLIPGVRVSTSTTCAASSSEMPIVLFAMARARREVEFAARQRMVRIASEESGRLADIRTLNMSGHRLL